MSAVRTVTVRCDRHSCSAKVVSGNDDEFYARKDAAFAGWITVGDYEDAADYCPRHRPKLEVAS